jgi:hypothetical protein
MQVGTPAAGRTLYIHCTPPLREYVGGHTVCARCVPGVCPPGKVMCQPRCRPGRLRRFRPLCYNGCMAKTIKHTQGLLLLGLTGLCFSMVEASRV